MAGETTTESTEDSDGNNHQDTVTRYEDVEDPEALASCLHRLTNHLHRNDIIELSERNELYDRIDEALGTEVPIDDADK